jgi:hypothetical protein
MSGNHDGNEFEFEKEVDIDVKAELEIDVDVDVDIDKDIDVKVETKVETDIEDNTAQFNIDVEAIGENTFVELDVFVLTTDQMSMITATGLSVSDDGY